MTLSPNSAKSSKIDCIVLHDTTTDNTATELRRYLGNCINNGRLYQLIDLDNTELDSDKIFAVCSFIARGLEIRLFNAKPNIPANNNSVARSIKMAGYDSVIKVYNEKDIDKAINIFETEIAQKKTTNKIETRESLRVHTLFTAEFKFTIGDSAVIAEAKVNNLSKSGFFLSDIKVVNATNKNINIRGNISGKLLYDFNFNRDGEIYPTTMIGKCVWESNIRGKLHAGAQFETETFPYFLYRF